MLADSISGISVKTVSRIKKPINYGLYGICLQTQDNLRAHHSAPPPCLQTNRTRRVRFHFSRIPTASVRASAKATAKARAMCCCEFQSYPHNTFEVIDFFKVSVLANVVLCRFKELIIY